MKTAITLILIAAIAAGGYYWYQGRDTRYARQVLDCIYSGNLEPIKDDLCERSAKELDTPAAKEALPKFGAQLKQAYGEVKTLEFQSEGPAKAPYNQVFGSDTVQKTWLATSDKGTFEWILFIDKDGKLITANPGALKPL